MISHLLVVLNLTSGHHCPVAILVITASLSDRSQLQHWLQYLEGD